MTARRIAARLVAAGALVAIAVTLLEAEGPSGRVVPAEPEALVSPEPSAATQSPAVVRLGVVHPSRPAVVARIGEAPPIPSTTPSPPPAASGAPETAPVGGVLPPLGPADVADGPTHRVATRVVVPALRIDLPVTAQPGGYPACNVAMYLRELRQPGQGGPVYLYAHARRGMFLPLLERSLVADGASMIGMTVEVYTGDSRRFVYRIDRVIRHARTLDPVLARRGESLWLQTSEGPRGTIAKLQVGAALVSSGEATFAASHPRPRPVACG